MENVAGEQGLALQQLPILLKILTVLNCHNFFNDGGLKLGHF